MRSRASRRSTTTGGATVYGAVRFWDLITGPGYLVNNWSARFDELRLNAGMKFVVGRMNVVADCSEWLMSCSIALEKNRRFFCGSAHRTGIELIFLVGEAARTCKVVLKIDALRNVF